MQGKAHVTRALVAVTAAVTAAVLCVTLVLATSANAASTVTVAGQTRALDGTNVYRATNYLVMYTSARGATTGTNAYGYEAAVVNGVVTQVANGVGNMAIPANVYVISGLGNSRSLMCIYY